MGKRLLICYAHPDDESFGMGGTIAKLVDEGVEVYLICATNGDVGTIPEEMQGQYDTIAELRLSELDCASKKLGFTKVFTLGYKDSGMMGSETSEDPASLWWKWNNEPDGVTRRVVEVMRDVRPQVVVTFNRYGGYGHPDHIAIQRATCAAWEVINDPNYVTDAYAPYQPQKLYFTGLPKMLLRIGIWLTRLRRQDPRAVGVNKDIDLVKIMDHIEPTHAQVDLRNYLVAWDDANACHESQGGGRVFRVPMWFRKQFMSKQRFTRVYPKPTAQQSEENDLFANVKIEPA